LPSAVTVGAGWRIRIEHAGTGNQVQLSTVSSQTLRRGATVYGTSYAMAFQGEGVTLVSDGGNWVLCEYSPPFMSPSVGVITVADRLSAPPGSPGVGAVYILTSSPSGAWSSFAEHNLAQWTGAGWARFVPPSNCGWHAYVQDEERVYRFTGSAWVIASATTTVFGEVQLATQAQMEAASDTNAAVVPGLVQHHPGVAKAWVRFASPSTVAGSHNVTSVSRLNEGRYQVNFTTAFSSANYCAVASAGDNTPSDSNGMTASAYDYQVGSVRIQVTDPTNNTWSDANRVALIAMGGQ